MDALRVLSGSARFTLRAATHGVHMRLHRHPLFAALADGVISPPSYRELLIRLYGFHAPLETLLVKAVSTASIDLQMQRRLRAARLRSDLQDLGVDQVAINRIPLATAMPNLSTTGRTIGALYVREGSTLGGRILARRLDNILGHGFSGRQFLAGDGDDSRLWAACCGVVEQHATSGYLDDMVNGAIDTFDCLERWLAMESHE
jgi:heme oxygenase (biliverdin-IX-beta and delta-forming)